MLNILRVDLSKTQRQRGSAKPAGVRSPPPGTRPRKDFCREDPEAQQGNHFIGCRWASAFFGKAGCDWLSFGFHVFALRLRFGFAPLGCWVFEPVPSTGLLVWWHWHVSRRPSGEGQTATQQSPRNRGLILNHWVSLEADVPDPAESSNDGPNKQLDYSFMPTLSHNFPARSLLDSLPPEIVWDRRLLF